jgi:asparagine synthase (glutamine-hydrolysing)
MPLESRAEPAQIRRTHSTPSDALIGQIAGLLDDQPCYVSFSGGRDSSLVLAAAVVACRERDHPPPIPVTYRFPNIPMTREDSAQEEVLVALRLSARIVLELVDVDLLGPATTQMLCDYGPLWPAQALATAGCLRGLEPGLFLTGEGGDDVLGPRRITRAARLLRMLVREQSVSARATSRAFADAFAPTTARTTAVQRRIESHYGPSWLEPALRHDLVRKAAQLEAHEPARPSGWPRFYLGLPWVAVRLSNLRTLHAQIGFRWNAPLLSPTFLGAVIAHTHWWEYQDRAALLCRHFADLVPDLVLARQTKASFGTAFFGETTRAFARDWDGAGVPPGVDAVRLRAEWLSAQPHVASASLVHYVWLAAAHGVHSTTPAI